MNLKEKILKLKNKFGNSYSRTIIKTFKDTEDSEIQEILAYVKKYDLTYFNYEWFHSYKEKFELLLDENNRYYYLYNNHRMYFKKNWEKERIQLYLKNLIPEQDMRSPHLYFATGEIKDHYECVVDAGVAEGMFALTIIDKVETIYLIECDKEWLEALELTFSPYKDRTRIIPYSLGMNNTDSSLSLDNLLRDVNYVDLLKLDIEGAELSALCGGVKVLPKIDCMLVCVYHYQDEEKDIRNYIDNFSKCNFKITVRDGYIFFLHDVNQKYPYLRRGCLKIERVFP